jgi:hypothetical protein
MGNTYKKKAKTPKKVTNSELQELQNIVGALNKLQAEIGSLDIQKFRAISSFNGLSNQMSAKQEELKEKYGNVIVNIQTGELKPDTNGEVN